MIENENVEVVETKPPFNMSEFLKDNLISGYQNQSFTKEQVNIFSMNYLMNGRLTQDDFDDIQETLEPVKQKE